MAIAFYVSITLALFAGALPAQILGVLWEMICSDLSVEIPYIALLKLLGGAGAVAAAIFSDKIRRYVLARDLIVGAIALEAMSLIGFSMSREFWNLGVWITALGFSLGLCFTLICYLIRATYSRMTSLLFVVSALGTFSGTAIVSYLLAPGRSWRTACQGLAIFQIILCMIIFLLRRILVRDVAGILRNRRKEAGIERQRRREVLIRERGEVDERSRNAFLVRLMFLYGAALCCGMLLQSAIHLTFSAQVSDGNLSFDLTKCILTVCGGMAAGRVAAHFFRKKPKRAWGIGSILPLTGIVPCMIAAWTGHGNGTVWFLLRFAAGCGGGMIFPNLIQTEDERFDDEAQTALTGLLPAFYLGSEAVITPFVQSMSGINKMAVCASAMLALTLFMGICLVLASAWRKKR
jgi:hypothetical protein